MRRGDIYWATLDPVLGHEQSGTRPVLIVQNDVGNSRSSTTIVAAITTNLRVAEFRFGVLLPDGLLELPSVVNCAQVRTIDRRRIGSARLAHADAATMSRVDDALCVSMGIRVSR